jgi:hypothetical protein
MLCLTSILREGLGMHRIRKVWFLVLCMVIAIPLYTVFAQSATNQTWTSEIAYFNTEDASGTLNITFYDSNGDVTSTDPIDLSPYQSGTLLIGSISGLGTDFSGSAVMSADVQLAAVYIEFVSGVESDDYDRKLYNGFTSVSAANTFYIPSVLKQKYGSTSQVGIQNVDSSLSATLTLEFYAAGATEPTYAPDPIILDPQSSYIFSMNDIDDADIPPGFTGSLRITSDSGEIVASAEETYDDDRFAYAFEGVSQGNSKVYVPTMLCRYGAEQQISHYAVQALGGEANITMRHYDRNTGEQLGEDFLLTIPDGGKASVNPCRDGDVPDGSIGSSVIESTGGTIIVLVKVNGEDGMRTAYIAEGSYSITGTVRIFLPWVQWNDDATQGYQSYIAVQNIGEADAEDVAAYYYKNDGSAAGDPHPHVLADAQDPLPPLVKRNTFAHSSSANAAVEGVFSGAVIIVSDQPVLVTVRNQTDVDLGAITRFSEDYTGIRYP